MSSLIDAIVAQSTKTSPRFVAHDLETETKKMADGTWDPMPYGIDPPKVLCEATTDEFHTLVDAHRPGSPWGDQEIVCGANWKFDYQHDKRAGAAFKPPLLWDVLVAEYLMSGQEAKFPSLNDVMKKWLGREKEDLIGDNLKKGIPPQKIDPAVLHDYAREDGCGTREVAIKQWNACSVAQRRLVLVQSMATLGYGDAEYNGMPLDKGLAIARRDAALKRTHAIQEAIRQLWAEKCEIVEIITDGAMIDWKAIDSEQFVTPRGISSLLFGVPDTLELEFRMATPIGRKKIAKFRAFTPQLGTGAWLDPVTFGAKKHSDGKSYLVSEEVLSQVRANAPEPYNDIAGAVLKMRESHKLGTTYYQNLIEFSERYGDNIIHPTIHAMSTATGRTSSANPNAQNQPEVVKEVIVAPEGYMFVEFDFSQLEVVALAHISGCEALEMALQNGDDIHYLTGLEAGLWKGKAGMTKEGRRNVKSVVFGLIYGGGAATLSAQSGVPIETVKKIIKAFYSKFPGTEKWQEDMINIVNNKDGITDYLGGVVREIVPGPSGTRERVLIPTPTGRLFSFTEQEAPEFLRKRGKLLSFSPTQIKNYFVQGFATGDIVPLAVMLLWEEIHATHSLIKDNLLTMMVHDSVLQAVPIKDVATTKKVLESLPDLIRTALFYLWDIKLDLPLKIEIKVTDRWSVADDAE